MLCKMRGCLVSGPMFPDICVGCDVLCELCGIAATFLLVDRSSSLWGPISVGLCKAEGESAREF
jgi:hypothetical protein